MLLPLKELFDRTSFLVVLLDIFDNSVLTAQRLSFRVFISSGKSGITLIRVLKEEAWRFVLILPHLRL